MFINTIINPIIICLFSQGYSISLLTSLHLLNRILGSAIQFLVYSLAASKAIFCFAFSKRNLSGFLFALNQRRINR